MKIIIFEGPDMSGKTYQAKEFARECSKENKLALYVHFPRIKENLELEECYLRLANTLYNDSYMKSLANKLQLTDNQSAVEEYQILKGNIVSNLQLNYVDKISFITSFIENDFFDNIQIHGNIIDIYHNEILIDQSEYNDLKSKVSLDALNNVTFIFDRYYISGNIYNYKLPLEVLLKYDLENGGFSWQLGDLDLNFTGHLNHELRKLCDQYNDKCLKPDYYDDFIIHLIFKQSEFVKSKSNKRVVDTAALEAYDNSEILNRTVNSIFTKETGNDLLISFISKTNYSINIDEILKNDTSDNKEIYKIINHIKKCVKI